MTKPMPHAHSAEDEPPPNPLFFTFSLELLVDPDTDPDGHQREWTRVVEHFQPRLHSYWRDRVRDETDRDILINEIWWRTVQNIRRLQAPGKMWNWLRSVGERAYLSHRSSRARDVRHDKQHAALAPEDTLADAPVSPLEGLAITDEVRSLFAGSDLSERDRGILMQWARGVEHQEIATAYGFPSAAASRKHIERVIKKLRISQNEGNA